VPPPRYRTPDVPDAAAVAAALAADDGPALSEMVIGLTAYGEDAGRALDLVRRLVTDPREGVRGNAVLGVGHAARRFGQGPADLPARVRGALTDPSEYVRGHAASAADDVESFLGIDLRVG
jgi:hypothetical protein